MGGVVLAIGLVRFLCRASPLSAAFFGALPLPLSALVVPAFRLGDSACCLAGWVFGPLCVYSLSFCGPFLLPAVWSFSVPVSPNLSSRPLLFLPCLLLLRFWLTAFFFGLVALLFA